MPNVHGWTLSRMILRMELPTMVKKVMNLSQSHLTLVRAVIPTAAMQEIWGIEI